MDVTLSDSGFTIKNVAPIEKQGKALIKVDFSYDPPIDPVKEPLRSGWVLLDPKSYWTIQSFDVQMLWIDKWGNDKAEYEYRILEDGFPVLTRVVVKRTTPKGKRMVGTYDYQLEEQDKPMQFSL